ncbi:hypothetical protein SAMN05421784_10836 [Xenorhabdus koppenhoeferi]|uniref:Uncharacterized protein n=1 Tax=Xenorhabdus koppenhoeferi TaxID=351659 RepID=A0A1I7GGC6_9GAMM|nr:hypothetical protein SAMN05421784_10836 [Xenorhabdus koppenhoeferi]
MIKDKLKSLDMNYFIEIVSLVEHMKWLNDKLQTL